jgi:hypothetical protein
MAEISSSPAKRRDVSLPRIQTSFIENSHPPRARPKLGESIILEGEKKAACPAEVQLSTARRQSKGGLFEFLGRSRSSMVQKPYQTRNGMGPGQDLTIQHEPRTRSQASEETQPKPLAKEAHASHSGLKFPAAALQRRVSKGQQKSKSDRQETDDKNAGSWVPPELVKVYPEAVRHVRLQAPLVDTETVLLQYAERKCAVTKEHDLRNCPDQDAENREGGRPRSRRERDKRAKRSVDDPWSHISWAEKVFVLDKSGYVLQYSGSGKFDRVPEKIMSLGKHSAAFVSDAIPGQHYVLQVSRVTRDDGTVYVDMPRSIFKKLGFRGDSRRSVSSFLLVFTTPEEMNEWLVELRKQIETLGGRKYLPDGIFRASEDAVKQIREKPSRRYLMNREPNGCAESGPKISPALGGAGCGLSTAGLTPGPESIVRTPSMARQKSIDSPSLSYMNTSTDQIHLEQLRGTPRMSYASAAGKTLSTSRGSSPGPSPALFPDELVAKPDGQEALSPASSQPRTLSVATYSTKNPSVSPGLAPGVAEQESRRTSTYSSTSDKPASWPPPNFSVPTFSKRYSCSTNASMVSMSSPPLSLDSQKKSTFDDQEKLNDLSDLSREGERLSTEKESNIKGVETTKLLALDLPHPTSCSSPHHDPFTVFSSSDGAIPRRFSSLPYSRDQLTGEPTVIQAPSPHPPPTIALPALPNPPVRRKSSRSLVNSRGPERPGSMHSHKNAVCRPKSLLPQIGLHNPSVVDEYTLSSPSFRALHLPPGSVPSHAPSSQPALHHRKTMPQLSTGFSKASRTDLASLSEIPPLLDSMSNANKALGETRAPCDPPRFPFEPVGVN